MPNHLNQPVLVPSTLHDNMGLVLQIAGKINRIIREQGLKEVGQLEQDLVFGDAGTKELINFLRTHEVEPLRLGSLKCSFFTHDWHISYIKSWGLFQDVSAENKLRLLMVCAAAYPDKFEGEKGSKLMQVISCLFVLERPL